MVVVSAPGKVTLFGEHAVVYGEPAIVTSIDRRVRVEVSLRNDDLIRIEARDLEVPGVVITLKHDGEIYLETDYGRLVESLAYVRKAIELTSKQLGVSRGVDITISSSMPVGAGLGTSAAVSVATIAAYSLALGHELKPEDIARLGWMTELEVQGSASPMDTAISTYGGLIYIRRSGENVEVRRLSSGAELPVVIGYVKREATTGEVVARVRKLYEDHPDIIGWVIRSIGRLTDIAVKYIEGGDLEELGILMNINHGLLDALGVSTKMLNDMVYASRRAGAYGSKITGAGGGGCIVALVPKDRSREVATAIEIVGGRPFDVKLGGPGVIVEAE